MAHSIKTFAFVLSLIGLSMGGDHTPESRRLPQRGQDPPFPDIKLMYTDDGDLMTYATTSINTLMEDEQPPEERCFPDVYIKATYDGCQFSRGFNRMNCFANFTKDGGSGRFDAMDVSCKYHFSGDVDPMRTHEQILDQAVIGQSSSFGWSGHGYCALFKVTYLGGYIRWGGDSHLPEKDKFGATPDYVLRATSPTNVQETSCWKKLQEISKKTKKNVKLCYSDPE